MRIGLFTDTYLPDINGVVTSIINLRKALMEQGHQVYVITNHPSLTQTKFEDEVLYLPGVELKFLYGYTFSTPIHRQAAGILKELDLDVIHIHSEFGIGIFGRIFSRQANVPMVTTYHTQYEDYTHYVNFFNSKNFEKVSRKMVAYLSRVYSKNVQVIIAPSIKTKEMLEGYDIRKSIVVIPSGLDLDKFKVRDEAQILALKQQYNFNDNFVINYTGRLAEEKSIDLVIEGFSKLVKERPQCHLMIVGDGPAKSDLENLAQSYGIDKHVTFVGAVKQNEIVSYYQISDAFVSASLTETQGLTFIEALANGLCVFARFDEPLKDIILEDETGFFFTDAEDFKKKVIAYLEMDPVKHEKLRMNAYETVDVYDLRSFGTSVLEAYQQAIDQYYGLFEIVDIFEANDSMSIIVIKSGEFEDVYLLSTDLVNERGLHIEMELSRNEIESLEHEQSYREARSLALQRLTHRDFTGFEMREYIHGKVDLTHDQMDDLIAYLEENRLIDDARYLNDKIQYHKDQLRGNGWIITDLSKRGFEPDDVEAILLDEDEDEYINRGLARAERFLSGLSSGSLKQRKAKLKDHLMRQGYENDVNRKIRNMIQDDYDDNDERESLRKDLSKTYHRYLRKDGPQLAKEKAMRYALGRGYQYDMIKAVIKEFENEED